MGEKCLLQNLVTFDQKPWTKPLEKCRFLDKIQIFFEKLSILSVCPKTSPKTHFRPLKGTGKKN